MSDGQAMAFTQIIGKLNHRNGPDMAVLIYELACLDAVIEV